MEFDQVANLCEGFLWIVIAAILSVRRPRHPEYADLLIIASLGFLLFGFSDFIEIFTRAWYHPPGLLLMKAACVVVLLSSFMIYRRRNRRPPPSSNGRVEKPTGEVRAP